MRLVLIALLMLVGCEQPDLETECQEGQYSFSVSLFNSRADIQREYESITGIDAGEIGGFTAYRNDGTEVYLLTLRHQNDRERMMTWGHEMAHVVCGEWHGEGDRW